MDKAAKGKSLGALAVLAFKKKPVGSDGTPDHSEPDGDEPGMTNEGASYAAAAESLGQMLNVPEGRRDQFKETLREVIHACTRGKYEEE